MTHFETPPELLKAICKILNTDFNEVKGISQTREIVNVRHYYCYIANVYYGRNFTLKMIGRSIGNRHHTTVMHGRSKLMDLVDSKDEKTLTDMILLREALSLTEMPEFTHNELFASIIILERKNKNLIKEKVLLEHQLLILRVEINKLKSVNNLKVA